MRRYFLIRSSIYILLLITFFSEALYSQISINQDSCEKKVIGLFAKSDDIYNSSYTDLNKNVSILSEAARLANECELWSEQVEALIILCVVYGDQDDEINFSETVDSSYNLALAKLEDNDVYFAYIYANLVATARKKRNYKASIDYALLGLNVTKNRLPDLDIVFYNRLAENYFSLGDYSKAIDCLHSAESIIISYPEVDYFWKFDTYVILAYLNKGMNNKDLATDYYLKAEDILSRNNSNSYRSEILNLWIEIAELSYQNNDFISGDRYIKKVENSNYIKSNTIKGSLYYTKAYKLILVDDENHTIISDLLKKSNDYLVRAKTTMVSHDIIRSENYELIGDVFQDDHLIDSAKVYYQKAIEVLGFDTFLDNPANISNKAQVIKVLSKLYDIQIEQGNDDYIMTLQNRILDIIKRLSADNTGASLSKFWANENQSIFEKFIDYNFERGDFDAVLSLIEENKSNILLKDINDGMSLGYANVPGELLDKGTELKTELEYYKTLQKKLEEDILLDTTTFKKVIAERNRYQLELDKHKKTLETEYPEYYKLKYNIESLNVQDVQDLLNNETLLVEFFIGQESGYVAFVTESKVEVVVLDSVTELSRASLNYYNSVSKKTADVSQSAQKLFKLLQLEKLSTVSPDATKLIIVADDFLNNIPFELLEGQEGSALINEYNISYEYSARLWKLLKSRKTDTKKYDFIGYAYSNTGAKSVAERSCSDGELSNIRCARIEIDSVMSIVSNDSSQKIDQSMSELLTAASNTRILHLATHACLDETDSDLSRIYFNDTLITNQELKLKNIGAELVVLSACETGFGEVVKGEGSMSLSKGFFHAGAKSTLVSLWPVDDCATLDLMTHFYKYLKSGHSKDEALRQAKLDYVKNANPELRHPYYWAGFILIGDSSPLWQSSSKIPFVIGGLLLLFVLIFLIRMIVKKK